MTPPRGSNSSNAVATYPAPGHEPLNAWGTLTLARDVEYTDYSLDGAEACAFEFVAWCRQGRPSASVPAWIKGQREHICRVKI